MIIRQILSLMVFLLIVPVMLGTPWTTLLPGKGEYRLRACFPIGFFVELAIFQLLETPIALLHLPFTLLCWAFTAVIAAACVGSGLAIRRKKKPFTVKLSALTRWEFFYLVVFLGLFCWQLYNGFVRDTTIWSYDDSAYVTWAADTLRYDAIQTIDAYTGVAQPLNVGRAIQGWLYFPAFLSRISAIPVTTMERTVLETFDILLAYTVYAYMASVLFRANRENRLIFLIILSVLHIFGWYSQYSVTFRLLGPNYQGKAVLAVSFFPLLFTLLIQQLDRPYRRKFGILLLLLSATASSFTMFGAATMIVNTVLAVGLSVVGGRRRWKNMRYILWGATLPGLYCGIYFFCKLV